MLMSEDQDCKYLKASDPETWQKPDDVDTWGDYMLRPDKPLSHRHRELARLAAHGKTQKEIAQELNYTQSRVSVLLSNEKIKNEVGRIRDKLFSADIESRIKDLSGDALDVMEEILISPHISTKDKETAAKWILEKHSGKPSQQVEHKGDLSIGVFLEKLDQERGKKALESSDPSGEVIDVQAKEPEKALATDSFTDWLDKNLDRD